MIGLSSSIKNVLIYTGHRCNVLLNGKVIEQMCGPYAMSVDKHLFSFHEVRQRVYPNWNITKISGSQIISALKNVSLQETLLVIPAGESTDLDNAFSDAEVQCIQESIARGLRFYVTCGSAYWLAKQRIWDDRCSAQPDSTDTIVKKGKMNIFSGSAAGPLSPYPSQTYSTAFFHESVKVKAGEREINVLLSGGGAFFSDPFSEAQALATYSKEELDRFGKTQEWQNAVIACSYGEGKGILSMLHPGYGPEDIDVDAYQRAFPHRKDDWQRIKDSLSTLEERMAFLAEVLQAGLETQENCGQEDSNFHQVALTRT